MKSHRAHGAVFSEIGFPNSPRVVPQEEDLHRAAEVLNASERVAMLIGAGAFNAEEVKEVADILGCGATRSVD
jgi:pyruvate dehydrogenase (quinone)